jgi:hypothetical protein
MTFGLLVGTLYATLSIGHDVHLHAMIAAEQRSSLAPVAPSAPPTDAPRIIDITAAAAANPSLLAAAVGLERGELIVEVNDFRFRRDDIEGSVPVFGLIGATPGSYLDLTVRRADAREDRVLVIVH